MFDNLRDESSSSPFYDDDKAQIQTAVGAALPNARSRSTRFLGMTAQQRFIIAVMLMIAVCVLGMMCMLITGKFGLY
jgi:hypothetical protein